MAASGLWPKTNLVLLPAATAGPSLPVPGTPSRSSQLIHTAACLWPLVLLRIMAEPARTKPRVLLGITGSVAAVKAGELIQALRSWAVVKVVYTAHALKFSAAAQAYNPDGAEGWQSIGTAMAVSDSLAAAAPALTCDDTEEVQVCELKGHGKGGE